MGFKKCALEFCQGLYCYCLVRVKLWITDYVTIRRAYIGHYTDVYFPARPVHCLCIADVYLHVTPH